MTKKLKIYLYYIVELDSNFVIYAFDKEQADSMIKLYEKNTKRNTMFLKISNTKGNKEVLNNTIKKFGSAEEIIKREMEILTSKRGL